MQKKMRMLCAGIFCVMCCLLCLSVQAESRAAQDVSARCTYVSPKSKSRTALLHDGNYTRAWQSARAKKVYLEVTLPEGELCSGVQVKWARVNLDFCVEVRDGEQWVRVEQEHSPYLTTFTPLDGVSSFRIAANQRISDRLEINELVVLGQGSMPEDIQVWNSTHEKADLMVFIAHPDDEYVFMGGVIPYYAAERGRDVLVAYLTESTAERRSELLDGLWVAGLRNYPVLGRFHDRYTTSLSEAYKMLGRRKTQRFVLELLRHYKPDVVVTHDTRGEYGHGMHKLCADLVVFGLENAPSEHVQPDLAKEYGTWSVKKAYLHLYPENKLTMDWHVPLEAFGCKTAFDVAQEGYAHHLSQQKTEFRVYDDGPYDAKQFGLAYSSVGLDVVQDDFFENIV